ncbi:beta-L-arabinofuranosidase (glycosyl hydrolase family 127) [Chitinophaga niastensis]|uniref:Beta-L-arabinofuranosidase (Glycosyl hydrolase family 127) n=1 Tax=Chitinophaga niastensis TaxID=536980 RepID=A0A2P8HJ50_CHINA|nr:beta-L-arabinofuranosidase (glycosyl hydrolase family 127) [Chitinophaga niastensis]
MRELALCQQNSHSGYIGAFPNDDKLWTEVAAGDIRSRGFDLNGAWSPWYTVHKIMAGLLDAWLYCNNAEALRVNKGLADWTGNVIKNLTEEQMQKMLICEYGGMAETYGTTISTEDINKYKESRFYTISYAIPEHLMKGKQTINIRFVPKVNNSAGPLYGCRMLKEI